MKWGNKTLWWIIDIYGFIIKGKCWWIFFQKSEDFFSIVIWFMKSGHGWNFKIYLGHSVSRWEWVWYLAKHVHPRGSFGKNCCRNSPVGACPETSLVKWLKWVMSLARFMNSFPLPAQELGRITFFFFLSTSSLVLVNGDHKLSHSVTSPVFIKDNLNM